jgi:hypothetical protein
VFNLVAWALFWAQATLTVLSFVAWFVVVVATLMMAA